MPFFFIDYLYIILVVPALVFAMIAQARVNSAFRKYARVPTRRNITGAQAAEAILRQNGISHIRVERIAGNLSDHYSPKENVIRLSEGVFDSTSVAAVGIASHEAGHAVQYAEHYGPIRVRNAIIPVCNIGSSLAIPLILIGWVLSVPVLATVGIAFFLLAVVFQLITLPVEYNASNRAMDAMEGQRLLYEDELPQAKKVLSAAALTYVASLLVSLAQLARLLLLNRGRRR
ncbi:zinc metallopeptidase [Oscillospiraceae bacterium OttesenSCG-928-G22]|nr:zinc metallopeptidase [Oscillospiraceae bacterium OttesenSCG-928-G22]